jgi:integrase
MPSANLTNAFVRKAKAIEGQTTEYRDVKTPALALRVTVGQSKSWTLRYRTPNGVQRRYTIGPYPAISLASARERALSILAEARAGGDPAQEKKTAKQEARNARLQTIGDLAERYFRDAEKGRHRPKGHPKRDGTLTSERYYYGRLIAPVFAQRPISELARVDIQFFVNRISDEHSRSSASQCLSILRQLFAYAVWHELVPANPCAFVEGPSFAARDRVLSDNELRSIWTACFAPEELAGLTMSRATGIAIQLALVTLQRRAEIAHIHTREIDLEKRVWTIPASRTKNKRVQVVPLSNEAIALIQEAMRLTAQPGQNHLHEGYLFPSSRKPGLPIEAHALTRAFGRMAKALGLLDVRVHDLRRTGATHMTGEKLGIPRFIVSQVLNHVGDTGGAAAVTSVYDRNAYLQEKRRALDAWALRLAELVAT